jgi:hypothetical protein
VAVGAREKDVMTDETRAAAPPSMLAHLDSVIAALFRVGYMGSGERYELAGRLVRDVRRPLAALQDDGR